MQVRRIFPVELKLSFETIFRIVESVNLVHPQGLFIEGVKPQSKTCKQAESQDQNLSSFDFIRRGKGDIRQKASLLSCNAKDRNTKRQCKISQQIWLKGKDPFENRIDEREINLVFRLNPQPPQANDTSAKKDGKKKKKIEI